MTGDFICERVAQDLRAQAREKIASQTLLFSSMAMLEGKGKMKNPKGPKNDEIARKVSQFP